MIFLDTNICIYAINKRSTAVLRALRTRDGDTILVSAVTVAELEYGIAKSAAVQQNRVALRHFLAPYEIVSFDEQAAHHYGDIRAALERSGRSIGPNDLLIAAHARSVDATLVTNNVGEFKRVPGLTVENWTQ